jgi:DNA-binding transcriptional regulator GbsR (MarR family)
MEKTRFIEKLGLYYENYGIPRIGGKILGLLLVENNPISAEQMSKTLNVSRSSVSTNVRFLVMSGFLEITTLSGSRTDYYTISEKAWENSIKMRIDGFKNLIEIIEQGIDTLSKDSEVNTKLTQMKQWSDMMLNGHEKLIAEWMERK